MKTTYEKQDFPVDGIRRYLEPGPIVLVSSSCNGEDNIMTMGWYTVMDFNPSLLGCYIVGYNQSFEMIRTSMECVINIPELHLIDTVIGIGNSTGREVDKFREFNLHKGKGQYVKAPLINECYASFECRVKDASLLDKYSFFILEVVKAHVATSPEFPKTVHYRGGGTFMVSGDHVSFPERFRPENL
ncbi:flavin reductase family protein [Dyadobacter sp. OTU695]|uniref:flavin reductase family protein n=1 Tax=Dyadobacter sp. OTU695 TaxID=3043860 RepID=UPI00313C2F60